MSGIPTLMLAQIEHGLAPLDPHTCARLAAIFNISPRLLASTVPAPPSNGRLLPQAVAVAGLGLAAALTLTQPQALPVQSPRAVQIEQAPAIRAAPPTRSVAPRTSIAEDMNQLRRATILAQQQAATRPAPFVDDMPALRQAMLQERKAAAARQTPAFTLQADGPHGCPLLTTQRLMMTQGYGEGTHAPAATMGAVDLVIDANGDGHDEPDATRGTPVVATLGGMAHVFPNSWPGGNFIIIVNERVGWSTAYGHLDTLTVTDGQTVAAGMRIGTVGSTGMASGPHLHYEVRSAHGNVDPAPLLQCGL
jgi:hypothetical protein